MIRGKIYSSSAKEKNVYPREISEFQASTIACASLIAISHEYPRRRTTCLTVARNCRARALVSTNKTRRSEAKSLYRDDKVGAIGHNARRDVENRDNLIDRIAFGSSGSLTHPTDHGRPSDLWELLVVEGEERGEEATLFFIRLADLSGRSLRNAFSPEA